MSANFFELMKFAKTGIASPNMTYYDKLRASTLMGATVKTLTGQPPLSFKSDGTPLISLSMLGNGSQTGTPTPDNPVMPEFVGVRTAQLFDNDNSALVFEGYNLAISNTFSKGGTGIVLRFPCEALTTYTISGYVDTTLFRVAQCNTDTIPDENTVSVSDMIKTTAAQTYTLTTSSDTKYILIQVGATVTPDYIGVLMINTGSTALPYEPYGYALPITNAGQTVPVYLGQTQTVRRIKKLVLDGTETIGSYKGLFYIQLPSDAKYESNAPVCTHFLGSNETSLDNYCIRQMATGYWGGRLPALQLKDSSHVTVTSLKNFFADQYAAGTPVTIWYVLATEQTGIVNEPLCKIGDYADELSSEDAAVTIPTSKGSNTLSVDTELQPSEMTITYKG